MLVSSCSEPQSRERINIALLLCDDLFPEIVVEHGEHAKIFEDFMRRSLTFAQCTASDHFNHDLELTMDVYDAQKMEYPSEEQIDGYDAFMCTGSASSAYDQVEWIQTLILFIAHLAKNHPKVKIFGICFGHQIISLALGGTCVIMNEGRWEIGPTKLCLTDVGEEIFGVKDNGQSR
ncbi:hypothetical protein BDP27DRAFT_1316761 [Rhodocollybia butyracea]|uniref:Glutamine amidotransferase domain-containing protein n=1 Tax=Rhodocollybia butyracea TaxID=206335 RepID=A0A9P5UD30_9AGAR|nr:hypothetical protein BDP27DRAFT_1316761 [Rhodocollybia butyracea]